MHLQKFCFYFFQEKQKLTKEQILLKSLILAKFTMFILHLEHKLILFRFTKQFQFLIYLIFSLEGEGELCVHLQPIQPFFPEYSILYLGNFSITNL